MSEEPTTPTDPDREDPPRFTRKMAGRGRHMIGDRVIREAPPRGRLLGDSAPVARGSDLFPGQG